MEPKHPTFQQIELKASKLTGERGALTDLGHAVDNVLDRARINAHDTIYVEKSAPESEYNSIALATIAQCLSCDEDMLRGPYWKSTPNQIRAWFRRHGIRY